MSNIFKKEITYGDILLGLLAVIAISIAIIQIVKIKQDVKAVSENTKIIKTELRKVLGKPTQTFRLKKGEIYFFDGEKSNLKLVKINFKDKNVLVKFSIEGETIDQILGLQEQRKFKVGNKKEYRFTLYAILENEAEFVVRKYSKGG